MIIYHASVLYHIKELSFNREGQSGWDFIGSISSVLLYASVLLSMPSSCVNTTKAQTHIAIDWSSSVSKLLNSFIKPASALSNLATTFRQTTTAWMSLCARKMPFPFPTCVICYLVLFQKGQVNLWTMYFSIHWMAMWIACWCSSNHYSNAWLASEWNVADFWKLVKPLEAPLSS